MEYGTFGRHVLAEIREASFETLDNMVLIEEACITGSINCGATVLNSKVTKFDPQGCSVTLTLSESHVAIHTFPESGYASFDAYTCGRLADPMKILHYVINQIGGKADYNLFFRGLPNGMSNVGSGVIKCNLLKQGLEETISEKTL